MRLAAAAFLFIAISACVQGARLKSSSPYAGATTATYIGNLTSYYDFNGYDEAYNCCATQYPNTHVCLAGEVGLIAQLDSLYNFPAPGVRYIDMSFGYASDGKRVDDCRGFTVGDSSRYSHCLTKITGGPILPTYCTCDMPLHFICCYDS